MSLSGGVLVLQPCRVGAEYHVKLLLDLGRHREESDLEGLLLVERGFEIGDEDAYEAAQFAAHLEDIVVDGADPLGEVLVDAGEKVTAAGTNS